MIVFEVLIIIIFLLLGVKIKDRFKIFNYLEKKLLNKLFFYHLAFSIVFFVYIHFNGGDGQYYWDGVKQLTFSEIWRSVITVGRPTELMFLLNYFPSNFLGLSFF